MACSRPPPPMIKTFMNDSCTATGPTKNTEKSDKN
jgi:hypothetical protein